MNRLCVLSLTLTLAFAGCVKSGDSAPPRPKDESGTPAPAPAAPVPSPSPSTEPSSDSSGEGSGGGRMAKPGWCQQDQDCPGGQVCEACEGEKCCVPGCHTNDQCGPGKRCNQVQCIRAPCPGMCE